MNYKFRPKPENNKYKTTSFLRGALDVGKSTMVRQICEEMELSYFKMLNSDQFKWYDQYDYEIVLEMC